MNLKKICFLIVLFLLVFSTTVLNAQGSMMVTYNYDENNRLLDKIIVAENGVHYQMKYEYDNNGNMIKREYGVRNFLRNGDFETVVIDPWNTWIPTGAIASTEIVQTTVYSGNQAMKISSTDIPQWQSVLINQTSQLDSKEQSYVYSGFINVEQLTGAEVSIKTIFLDENYELINQKTNSLSQPTDGYVPIEIKGITPENVKYVKTEVHIKATQPNGSGTIIIDDLNFQYAASNIPTPTDLMLLGKSDKSVDVSWNNVSEAVSYEIYKDETLVGTSPNPYYTIAGLTPSTTYDITVRAQDTEGFVSLPSSALSITTEVAGTNLLTNGGFDTIKGDAGWKQWLPPTATGELVVVDAPVDAGNQAFKLTAGGLSQWNISFIKQTVEVDPNTSFKLHAALYYEQKNNAGAVLRIVFKDANGEFISQQPMETYQVTTEYVPYEILGMTPDNAVTADVEVQIKALQPGGGGTVYVDTLSLEYAQSGVPAPENVTLLSKTDKTVDVSWGTVTEAVYYEVYKGTTKVGTSTDPYYTIAGLSPSTSYDITVRAQNAEGFVSLPSSVLSLTTEAVGTNLLTNGGFDTIKGDAGWRQWIPPTATGELVVVDTPVDAGNHAFKLTAGGLNQWSISYIKQTVNVDPNTSFKLNAALYYEQKNNAGVVLRIVFRDANGEFISQQPIETYLVTTGYIPYEILGMTPENAVTADVEVQIKALQNGGGGTVYVDTLSLEYAQSGVPAPENVTLLSKTDKTVDVSWSTVTEAVYYEVYKGTTKVGTSTDPYYTIAGLSPNTAYDITIRTQDESGFVSLPSSVLSVTTETAGTNLLTNGGFDTIKGDAGWRQWIPPTAAGELKVVDTPVDAGNHAFKLTAGGLSQWNIAFIKQTLEVDPNTSFKLHAALYYEQKNNAGVVLRIVFRDANGEFISQQPMETYQVTTEYVPYEILGMTPENAVTADVEVQIKALQPGGGGTVYVDTLSLEYAQSGVPAPENVTLLSKTDKTVDVSWSTVTEAVYYEVYRGTTKVGTSTVPYYTIAGLSPSTSYDITIRAQNAEGFVSLPSSALSLTTEAAGTNLLTNGGFDTIKGDAGWKKWLPPTATGELVVVDAPVDAGTHAFKLTAGGLAQWSISYIKQTVEVDPNTSFKLHAALYYEQKNNAGVVLRIVFRDANGEFISQQPIETYLVTTGYIPYEILGMTPENAVTADVEVQIKALQPGGGGTVYVDTLSLEYAQSGVPAPENVTLLDKTDKTVDVSWSTVTEAVYYEVYKGTTKVGTSTAPYYTIAGLSPNTAYDITIRAQNAEGFVSLPSSVLNVTTEAAGTNLLTNGGFDTIKGDAGWKQWIPLNATGELVVVDAPVDIGTHAFKLMVDGLAQWDRAFINQKMTINPNEAYKLNMSLNIQQMDNALITFRIVFEDVNEQFIEQKFVDKYYSTSGFVPLEIMGMTPMNAVYAKVEVQLKASQTGGGGTAYVDSLSLEYDWVPRNLSMSEKTDTSIDLIWQAPSNESVVTEYEIYQDGILIDTSLMTQFTVTGLNPTTLYHFTVKAKHVDGFLSMASNELKVTTQPIPGYYSIMPLGASITDGYNIPGGYRIELWNKLANDEFLIDFVGSQSSGPINLLDQDHEGHPGLRIDEIHGQLAEWIIYEPNMIIIHLGTNDMFDNGQANSAVQDLQQLINEITTKLPNTHVVVSSLVMLPINDFERNSYVLSFNSQIPGIVDSFRNQGKLVTFVDMYPAIDITDISIDLIHPTGAGYDKMAVVWYDTIQSILTSTDKVPSKPDNVQLVSHDGSAATFSWTPSTDNVGVTGYDIYQDTLWLATTTDLQFTASDLPVNTLVSFTIVAKDAAGNESLPSEVITFSTVPPSDDEAPSIPTAVQVSSVTTSSIDLTWNASTDNVGVVGYNIYLNGEFHHTTDATNYIITDLDPNSSFTIQITAFDAAGNESGESVELIETTATPINLVQNPGFESGSLTPWSIWNAGVGTVVTGTQHSGQYELRISPQSGGQQDLSGYGLNKQYRLGVWGRVSDSGESAKVTIKGTNILHEIQFTNTIYEYKTVEFTSPSEAQSWLSVQYWNGSSADLYIDDVQVFLIE